MSRNGTWLIAAAIRESAAAAASALPPPIEEPKVATRSGSIPGSDRANEIASRQLPAGAAGETGSSSPPLSPKPRWSKADRGKAGPGKRLRKRSEPVAPRAGEAVRHDDDRDRAPVGALRPIQPRGAAVAVHGEGEVLAGRSPIQRAPAHRREIARQPELNGRRKRTRPRVSGEGGIRTLERACAPYSLSRRVPSATRPPLRGPTH